LHEATEDENSGYNKVLLTLVNYRKYWTQVWSWNQLHLVLY